MQKRETGSHYAGDGTAFLCHRLSGKTFDEKCLPEISSLHGQYVRGQNVGISFVYQSLRTGKPLQDCGAGYCGTSVRLLLDSPLGGTYTAVEEILTTAVTAIILLVVGYGMEMKQELLKPCLQTILIRLCIQAVMITGILFTVHRLIGTSQLVDIAIIIYMSAPAPFSMQTFLKKEEGNAYVSTTNSLYCIVTILIYVMVAAKDVL